MNGKMIVAVLGGVGVGGAGAWFMTKRFYEQDCDQQIEDVKKKFYDQGGTDCMDLIEDLQYKNADALEEIFGFDVQEDGMNALFDTPWPVLKEQYDSWKRGTRQDTTKVKSPVNYQREGDAVDQEGFPKVVRRDGPAKSVHVEYSGYYKNLQNKHADSLHPLEAAGAEKIRNKGMNSENKIYANGESEDKENSKPENRNPVIISEASFNNEYPEHDKVTLLYYTENHVLATEDDEVIKNVEQVVGAALAEFQSDVVDDVFVRNIGRGTDYWIERRDDYYEGDDYDPDVGGER